MLKNTNRVIALALAGLLGISGLPAPALAETMTISRAGSQGDASEAASASEAVAGAAAETVSEAVARADALVHRMDEPTWNADETFAEALAKRQAGLDSTAQEAGAPAARTIRRGGGTAGEATRDAASPAEAESETALNGLRIAVTGDGMGVRYRLREADGWQQAWTEDGAICSSAGAVSGLAVELTGESAAGYDLWVCLRGSDGRLGAWGVWVPAREGTSIEVPEGTYVTDVAVELLRAPSAAPEPLGEAAVGEGPTATEVATETEAVQSVDVRVVPSADEVSEAEETGAAAEEGAAEADETAGAATPVAQAAAEPVALVGAAEQPREAPLVAAASDIAWARLSGDTRYDTMMAISGTGFNASEFAVITTGRNFPDALSASGLAGALGCPVLLTDPDSLSWQAASELERLGVTHAIIIGGAGAVSADVEAELVGMGIELERISGADRMATSVAVFDRLATATGSPKAAIVASGQGFADALSISPYAYATKTPILLTDASGHLTDAELATLAASAVQEVIIVGGTSAVSAEVEDQLSFFSTSRLSGDDRYATSTKIAEFEQASGLDWEVAYVCTGKTFPDALAGSALAGSGGSILVIADSPSHPTIELLRSHAQEMDHGVIFGGKNAFPFDDPLAAEAGEQSEGQPAGKTGGKTGYQNPEGFYQVSSDNVTITSAATAPFNYITPSRIAADATREDCVAAFIGRAEEYIGTPYVWNYACAPGVGVDCIGLVYQCAYACGMDLGGGTGDSDFNPWAHYITGHSGWHSHDANNFWDYGLAMHVSLDARKPGDLISYPGHIAIYLGDDQIIHAYTPDTGVIYDDMWNPGTPRGCIRLFQ